MHDATRVGLDGMLAVESVHFPYWVPEKGSTPVLGHTPSHKGLWCWSAYWARMLSVAPYVGPLNFGCTPHPLHTSSVVATQWLVTTVKTFAPSCIYGMYRHAIFENKMFWGHLGSTRMKFTSSTQTLGRSWHRRTKGEKSYRCVASDTEDRSSFFILSRTWKSLQESSNLAHV